jgi:alpha-tubulin suppressor-like RCC1 family protein/subtilisin family serine protease
VLLSLFGVTGCDGSEDATPAALPAGSTDQQEQLPPNLPEPPKPATTADERGNEFVLDQLVVTKAETVSDEAFEEAILDLGARVLPAEDEPDQLALQTLGVRRVQLPEGVSVTDAQTSLMQSGVAAAAEADYVVPLEGSDADPNDPLLYALWGLTKIHTSNAWTKGTGSTQVIVAVLDTGFSATHLDLRQNLYTNPGEIANNGVDDDHNGYVDDVHGWDMIAGDARPDDEVGHGTHVSGTIGAQGDNATGVVGLNWRVSILPIQVCASWGCLTSKVASGLLYAAHLGARVANASLGGSHPPLQYEIDAAKAFGAAGGILVAAAGNSASNNDNAPVYPADYDSDNVISVAATDRLDHLATFSNYGATSVDLAAPGVDILSTYLNNAYRSMSGTSMATPHVAGALALYIAADPTASVRKLRTRLLQTVDPVPELTGKVASGGRLSLSGLLLGSSSCDDHGGLACDCQTNAGGNIACQTTQKCSSNPCNEHAGCVDDSSGFVCSCKTGYQGDGFDCQDFDECESGDVMCGANARCLNLPGSFECQCLQGFSGDGQTCTDVDECAMGADTCPDGAHCQNTVGSYKCDCPGGTLSQDGTCVDIDECAEGLDSCDPNATCSNDQGSYSCTCNERYAGDGFFCFRVSECSPGDATCDEKATCTQFDWGYGCLCGEGWEGTGSSCQDVDECKRGTDKCDPNAECTNTPGGYTCSCNEGYLGTGYKCSDIDECKSGASDCGAHAHCTNAVGSFSCACDSGYTGDGHTCVDQDECASGTAACDPHASCKNTVGAYECSCNAGYSGTGRICTDVDECLKGSKQCVTNALCVNTPGGADCVCAPGYQGNGTQRCDDVDECATGTDECSANARCTNSVGSYSCRCFDGFEGDGKKCDDVDECAKGTAGCDVNATCTNTPGSYECACAEGWEGGGLTCSDVDECQRGWQNCGRGANCKNTPGAWHCVCKEGFKGNGGGKCEDIDECATSTDNCDAHATCTNTDPGFSCECNEGYIGDGVNCVDENECTDGSAECSAHATCTNTAGGYTCACNAGYTGDGKLCGEIDECANALDDCDTNAACTDTDPGFTCACKTGYTGTGKTCQDVNECSAGTAGCDPHASCTNNVGSFACKCNTGYKGDGKHCTTSSDVDECALGTDNCADNALCINTEGSFSCTCKLGYNGDGRTCTDINECSGNPCSPNATCANTAGGYTCTCKAGFEGNGIQCKVPFVDECASGAAHCAPGAKCIDKEGGYSCLCPAGYTGDGTQCTDIDECKTGTAVCSPDAHCGNTAGTYTCTCNTGFTGDGHTCLRNECTLNLDDCDAHAICQDQAQGYSCTCGPGYQGDGKSCTDIDECQTGTDECDPNAKCSNTVGGYKCTCNPGYDGSGTTCLLPPTHTAQIDSRADHTCALLDNGGVRCWGRNTYGQLGLGHTRTIGDDEEADAAGYVDIGGTALEVTTGVAHSCALLSDGNVRCWGRNAYGQLGLGHTEDIGDDELPIHEPVIDLGGTAAHIAAGGEHTCALLTDGTVRCWGLGINGQLGYGSVEVLGDDEPPSIAGPVPLGGPVQQLIAGRDHSCALMTSGAVRCWGRGKWAPLGYGNINDVGDDESANGGGDVAVGASVVQLTTGWYHTCALDNQGGAHCWGYGSVGQLGYANTKSIGDDEKPSAVGAVQVGSAVTAISAGMYHTCAIVEGGHVRCWGYGKDGRLGYASTKNVGDDEYPKAAGDVDVGGTVLQLATGSAHTCALLDDGTVKCWGDATYGQLGTGSTADIGDNETPAGSHAVLASLVDECALGTASCGDNMSCTDKRDGYTCACSEGFQSAGTSCADIDECALGSHDCDVNAKCANTPGSYTCTCNDGYHGDGRTCTNEGACVAGRSCDLHAVCSNLSGSYTCECRVGYTGDGFSCSASVSYVTQVVAGHEHTCALFSDGSVSCWGYGNAGQLGYGNTLTIGDDETPAGSGRVDIGGVVKALAAGGGHTCALMTNGEVRCWGRNDYGQLGYGNKTSIGDDETPASAGSVDVGGKVVQLSAGENHTCALLDTGAVRCWGVGSTGRLGYGNGNAIGDNETPKTAGNVNLGDTAIEIAAGDYHTCAVLSSGTLRCWGYGAYGQLGLGATDIVGDNEKPSDMPALEFDAPVTHVRLGHSHTCVLFTSGTVRCWGQGRYGALGNQSSQNVGDDEDAADALDVDLGGTAVDLVAGQTHTCALLDTHAVRCWGYGQSGALGYGDTRTIGDDESPASISSLDLGGPAFQISSSWGHTCALFSEGVKCWGDASGGKLGYASTKNQGDDETLTGLGFVSL